VSEVGVAQRKHLISGKVNEEKKKKKKKKGKETQLEKENSPNILLRKWGTCRYG